MKEEKFLERKNVVIGKRSLSPLLSASSMTQSISILFNLVTFDQLRVHLSIKLTKHLSFNQYLHPTNMTHMVNIFSQSVVGETLPKPTEVKLLKVK